MAAPCKLISLKGIALRQPQFTCHQYMKAVRSFSTSPCCEKHVRSGVYKSTTNRSRPLTYEEAQKPHQIGVTKAWNSWNTSNLAEEEKHTPETTAEDFFIRKFIFGTWHNLFVSEVIIKRRQNLIIIAGLVQQSANPRKMYFLEGYTTELLSHLLKRPVQMEIQTVTSYKDVQFKWI